ncbi:hypothetical protein BH09ACT4_BH09ACT4_09530 [soil metagenome]
MQKLYDVLRQTDGLATTAELRARGIERGMLDVAVMYRRVLRVRKGVWCLPELDAAVLAAQRAKGRLACVSALVFHEVIENAGFDLHVSAPPGQVSWHPRSVRSPTVRHWSRQSVGGDRFSVSVDVAWAQFALCRAVAGRDVRLRQTGSL